MPREAGTEETPTVHVWEMVEVALTAARDYPNPYVEADVWVDLEGPDGARRVTGFWDGGRDFRIRILAPQPGLWRWRSGSDPDDPGLSGRSGSFRAIPWTEAECAANACRRGMPRATPNGHALEYADGTPCFLVGDTWWAAPTARFPWAAQDDGSTPGPGMSFQAMVDVRRAQGFNCIAMIAAFPNWANDGYPARLVGDDGVAIRAAWEQAGTCSAKDMHNEGGRPFLFPGRVPGYEDVFPDVERLNPAYFRALDRKMACLNAHGFIPFLEAARRDVTPAWQAHYPWPTSYARYVQYVWARYQAFICVLSPLHFDSPSLSVPARSLNAAVNDLVARNVPAFGNLLSCNAAGSSLLNFGGASEAPWLTLHQIGNLRDHNSHWLLTHIYEEARPARPALNGEPYYPGWPPGTTIAPDSAEADLGARSGMYGSLLSGGLAGHFYGSVGLWGGDVEPEAPWKTWQALAFRSGAQMGHLGALARSLGTCLQALEPHADYVYPNKVGAVRGNRGWAYCAATADRRLVLVYREADCPPLTLRTVPQDAEYALTWFDPRTGAWHAAGAARANVYSEMHLPDPPTGEDWLLRLTQGS